MTVINGAIPTKGQSKLNFTIMEKLTANYSSIEAMQELRKSKNDAKTKASKGVKMFKNENGDILPISKIKIDSKNRVELLKSNGVINKNRYYFTDSEGFIVSNVDIFIHEFEGQPAKILFSYILNKLLNNLRERQKRSQINKFYLDVLKDEEPNELKQIGFKYPENELTEKELTEYKRLFYETNLKNSFEINGFPLYTKLNLCIETNENIYIYNFDASSIKNTNTNKITKDINLFEAK